jgi:glucose-1-phosphate adenylyltransferase
LLTIRLAKSSSSFVAITKSLAMNVLTMVLAGGAGLRLLPLTRNRAKPAVPFAGSLRVIDFTLFNCAASGLDSVHVLTQYRAESLDGYLRARWGSVPGLRAGFVRALPSIPAEAGGRGSYAGTADAVFKNLAMLEGCGADVVLVLSGDHIYRADYRSLIDAHLARRAAVTILTGEASPEEAPAFGVLEVSPGGRVLGFIEKPLDAMPYARGGRCRINLGIYCFDPCFLAERLLSDASEPRSSHDFGRDVLPASLIGGEAFSFPLALASPDDPPYWRDVGTIESYFEASMDLVRSPPRFRLEDPRWQTDSPFLRWLPRSHPVLEPGRSLLSRHVEAGGARLVRCVVSPHVCVKPGATVEECVLLPGCVIGEGARLRRAIVEEGVHVPAGACAVGEEASLASPRGGISVVCEEPVRAGG